MGNSCIPNNSLASEFKGKRGSFESLDGHLGFNCGNIDSAEPIDLKAIINDSEGLYEGEVNKSNKKQGYGVQIYKNGERYEGYWVNNRPMGNGSLAYTNGDLYYGEVKDGKRHGYGSLSKPNGDQ